LPPLFVAVEAKDSSSVKMSWLAKANKQRESFESDPRLPLTLVGQNIEFWGRADMSGVEFKMGQAVAGTAGWITGAVIGAEALVRWQDAEGNHVSPERFIPVAERCGLINDLGDWILNQVNADAKTFAGQLPSKMTLAVNLSPLQFNQSNFVERLTSTLKQLELEFKIELELTESAIMNSGNDSIAKLHQLKNLGFKLAIDDFGTGYSSLNYLRQFPINTLKIDRAFINDLGSDSGNGIVNAIISMAHALGLDLVAEGVETAEQAVYLRERNCYSIQGYLISKPVPIEELARLSQQDFRPIIGLDSKDG